MPKLEFPIKYQKRGEKEMKIKKRKGKQWFPIDDRKKVKTKKIRGKQNSSWSIKETKEENRRSSNQINFRRGKWPPAKGKPILKWFFLWDCHSRSLQIGDVPPHINKEEKTETPNFLSKNTTDAKGLHESYASQRFTQDQAIRDIQDGWSSQSIES